MPDPFTMGEQVSYGAQITKTQGRIRQLDSVIEDLKLKSNNLIARAESYMTMYHGDEDRIKIAKKSNKFVMDLYNQAAQLAKSAKNFENERKSLKTILASLQASADAAKRQNDLINRQKNNNNQSSGTQYTAESDNRMAASRERKKAPPRKGSRGRR